jgi:NAD(P)-dependent dehydrogenase (short-subunit alcohol dehydrogenase family)
MSAVQILVTGSTDGIGRQTALDLARMGADVIVHGRTREKADATAEALGTALKRPPLLAVAGDLASLAAVRALGAEVLARAPQLKVVIHNAGVLENKRQVTVDGFELTFAVNHLAPFLLTHLLLDCMKARAPARIVNVSSGLHSSGHIDFDDLQMKRGFDGVSAYSASKLANVLFTNELARRLGSTDVAVYALHPGVISTKLLHRGFGSGGGASVQDGARTSVFAATDPSLAGRTALYLSDARVATSAPVARDPERMRRLYDESCKLTGITGLPG